MGELLDFLARNEDQFRSGRLASLYSDFRYMQASNPEGYRANLTAWESGLSDAAKTGHIPGTRNTMSLSTGPYLLQALETYKFGKPLALGAVIEDAVAHGRMIPHQIFLQLPTSIYNQGWYTKSSRIISWGFQKLGFGKVAKNDLLSEQYVILGNVEDLGNQVISKLADRDRWIDAIIPMGEFKEIVRNVLHIRDEISSDDLSILLVHLSRDRRTVAYSDKLVKLRRHPKHDVEITEQDVTTASLKCLITDLAIRTQALTTKVDGLKTEAQNAIEAKNRIAALRILRSKKLHVSILVRRSETLAQLVDVYNKIEESADQVEAVRVMQASTKLLRGLNADIGGLDKVDQVLDDLNIEIGKVNEIGAVISEHGPTTQPMDEGEIEEELETLVAADRAAKENQRAIETKERLDTVGPLPSIEDPISGSPITSPRTVSVDHGLDEGILTLEKLSVSDESMNRQLTRLKS